MRKASPAMFLCKECFSRTTTLYDGLCYDCYEMAEINDIRTSSFRRFVRALGYAVLFDFDTASLEARMGWQKLRNTGDYAPGGYFDTRQPHWREGKVSHQPYKPFLRSEFDAVTALVPEDETPLAPRPFMPDADRIQAQNIKANDIKADTMPKSERPRFADRPRFPPPGSGNHYRPVQMPTRSSTADQGSDRSISRSDTPSSSSNRAQDDGTGFILGLTTGIPTSPSGIVGAAIHNSNQAAATAAQTSTPPACPTPDPTPSPSYSSDTGSPASFSCDP